MSSSRMACAVGDPETAAISSSRTRRPWPRGTRRERSRLRRRARRDAAPAFANSSKPVSPFPVPPVVDKPECVTHRGCDQLADRGEWRRAWAGPAKGPIQPDECRFRKASPSPSDRIGRCRILSHSRRYSQGFHGAFHSRSGGNGAGGVASCGPLRRRTGSAGAEAPQLPRPHARTYDRDAALTTGRLRGFRQLSADQRRRNGSRRTARARRSSS
jgi:hypothetical protein